MSPTITTKLPRVGTTIFTLMSQLAAECGALNLSQGFPDFAVHPDLIEAVAAHMRAGHNQYAPMAGVPALGQAIAAKVQALYGATVDPRTEVTVTSGATEALFCAITAVVRPGDEVIVLDPAYDAYEPVIELAGGRAVHLPLVAPDYHVDWERVADAIGPRTRMLILNSPHNPTGAVLDADDMAALAGILARSKMLVLSDEVYEHIVFDDRRHESLLRHSELAERSFVVSSFGKTFHATGWKIGYCVAPAALTAELRKVHQYVTFATSTPVQHALADFMSEPARYLGLPAFYQAKRDRFCDLLAGSRFRLTPTRATYFQLLDYGAITDEADVDYARRLTRDAGVASIPISVFSARPGNERVLRFCFAKDDATLERAARILRGL